MARSRKNSEPEALLAAMRLFWREGFHTVGTRRIETETGITRFTLQNAYGGKRALFLVALDQYLDRFERIYIPQVTLDGIPGIARWFTCPVLSAEDQASRVDGCLMINSITEFPRDDADVGARAERFYGLLRAAFLQVLSDEQSAGLLRDGIVPEAATELLVGIAVAMNVEMKSAQAGANPAGLAQATAAMIEGWRAG
jgi:TetR/AcrR family transcriptional repressor of nem operon